MQNEYDVLKDIATRLGTSKIPYMLTGSLAMGFYAQPRMTRDIDLVVALDIGDVASFIQSLEPDYYVSDDAVKNAIVRKSIFNAVHLASVAKVDFVIRKDAPFRRVEFDQRTQITFSGIPLWIVGKEDLILSKLTWALDSNSEIQLNDVRNLVSTGCNRPYIESWVQKLGIEALGSQCANA